MCLKDAFCFLLFLKLLLFFFFAVKFTVSVTITVIHPKFIIPSSLIKYYLKRLLPADLKGLLMSTVDYL